MTDRKLLMEAYAKKTLGWNTTIGSDFVQLDKSGNITHWGLGISQPTQTDLDNVTGTERQKAMQYRMKFRVEKSLREPIGKALKHLYAQVHTDVTLDAEIEENLCKIMLDLLE